MLDRIFSRKNGYMLILIPGILLMTLGDACTRFAEGIPLGQKILVRSIVGMLPALTLKYTAHEKFVISRKSWLSVRIAAGFLCTLTSFYAVTRLNYSEFSILKYLSPVFTFMGGVLIFREKYTRRTVIGQILSFLGVIIIFWPTLQFSGEWTPRLVAIVSALMGGIVGLCERGLGEVTDKRTNASTISILYLSFSAIVSCFMSGSNYVLPNRTQWIALILQAVLFASGQMCMTLTYMRVEVTKLCVFDYTAPAWAVLIGIVLFAEIPSVLFLVGALLVISGGIISTKE